MSWRLVHDEERERRDCVFGLADATGQICNASCLAEFVFGAAFIGRDGILQLQASTKSYLVFGTCLDTGQHGVQPSLSDLFRLSQATPVNADSNSSLVLQP